jgi:hypothetical protein
MGERYRTMIKTGEVFDRDENDDLWLCESFVNPKTGEVTTTRTKVTESEDA